MVKGNVDVVEKEVRLAEKDYGTLNSIKKVMSGLSIFGSKKVSCSCRNKQENKLYVQYIGEGATKIQL